MYLIYETLGNQLRLICIMGLHNLQLLPVQVTASTKLQNPHVFCFSLPSCSSCRKEPFPDTGILLVMP